MYTSIYIHISYMYLYNTNTHTIHTLCPKFFQNSRATTQPTSTSRTNKSNLNLFGFFHPKINPSTHSIFFCHFLIKSTSTPLRFLANKHKKRIMKENAVTKEAKSGLKLIFFFLQNPEN